MPKTLTAEPEAPIPLGDDEIVGVVGEGLTPQTVTDLAAAYGTWLGPPGAVVIGRDFRTTSSGIAQMFGGALQLLGFDVVDLGPVATPCFRFNVRAFGAKGGLIVTAAHRPPEFNGIKLTGPNGLAPSAEAAARIREVLNARAFVQPHWMSAGTIRSDPTGPERYLGSIRQHADADRVRRARLAVVLDPGNGASALFAPALLRELGCRLTPVNSNPDGWFPGRLPEPSEENLAGLSVVVRRTGSAVGIAHDGDAERAAFLDEQGSFVPGDVALSLFARYQLRRHPGGTVVTSHRTSTGVQEVVERAGGQLVRTHSGGLAIAAAMERSNAILGGEENGQYYWPEHQMAPDGPMTSAMMLEMLAREGRPLSELVREVPVYHRLRENIQIEPALRGAVVEAATSAFRETADRIETTDGVKAYFPGGWVLIRPSSREPTVRVDAEATTPARAESFAARGVAVVREAVAALPVTARRPVAR